jgi:hypothetical protein
MNDKEHSAELLMQTLRAYIYHVGLCEGVDFLYEDSFTPEQWVILQEASARNDAEIAEARARKENTI